jgi:enamine deaminase RidA (YjgF/YER057c/UK114 family)
MNQNSESILPDGWKRPKGYSNAVVLPQGRPLFIAGMVGWDENETFTETTFVGQFRQALLNIKACVEKAGSRLDFIGRFTIYVDNLEEYRTSLRELGAVYRDVMGTHYPAMALVEVSALLEEGAKLEIEATGVVPE